LTRIGGRLRSIRNISDGYWQPFSIFVWSIGEGYGASKISYMVIKEPSGILEMLIDD
jgi:hypothetical protein